MGEEGSVYPRTIRLRSCVELAQTMADRDAEPVEVVHLVTAVLADPNRHSRARLVAHALGAHHLIGDAWYALAAQADTERSERARSVPLGAPAQRVLERLPYWTTRTGDRIADTVHLLLACLEADPHLLGADGMGLTVRAVVRAAMEVRGAVSPDDRQVRMAGPILSDRRADRPSAYRFENPWRDISAPSKPNPQRSQQASLELAGTRVQSYLMQWHVWTVSVLVLAELVLITAGVYAALTVTAWSLLWALSLLRRDRAPLVVRLLVDAGVAWTTVLLGAPWWLVILALWFRAIDILEGRLALLQARGGTADPRLTLAALRAERRAGIFARLQYDALRATGGVSDT